MPTTAVTVTTTAAKIAATLGRQRRTELTLSLPAAATAAIFTSDDPGVTTANGLPLYPGEERSYTGSAARRDHYAVAASGSQDLRVSES